jgi:hypothetical protein
VGKVALGQVYLRVGSTAVVYLSESFLQYSILIHISQKVSLNKMLKKDSVKCTYLGNG